MEKGAYPTAVVVFFYTLYHTHPVYIIYFIEEILSNI